MSPESTTRFDRCHASLKAETLRSESAKPDSVKAGPDAKGSCPFSKIPGVLAAVGVMATGFYSADVLGHMLLEFQGTLAKHFVNFLPFFTCRTFVVSGHPCRASFYCGVSCRELGLKNPLRCLLIVQHRRYEARVTASLRISIFYSGCAHFFPDFFAFDKSREGKKTKSNERL